MRTTFIAAALAVGTIGGLAMAEPGYEHPGPATRQESAGTPGGAPPSDPTIPAERGRVDPPTTYTSPRPDASGAIVQGSRISGHVTDLDRDDGEVTVALSNGQKVTLQFPQAALASFREGDPVTLTAQVGMAERPPADRD